ncbi:hypothetical protein OE749_17860 [Aestuariibacter sp. AA17]|uniref:Uncharacterized protein n=1 Tax=Fluctibacter corallii TaxID=2984329 RepID=A0ABT3AD24_9ALTE|nr:hypothetical protein [Aestuariibacter sp. AA17]MCV2886563.1 hypothetical protein [Aestuariibacter sp. AA17]
MHVCKHTIIRITALSLTLVVHATSVHANDDDELAKLQAQLNAEVLSKPFLAEKPEEVDAYIKSMLEQNIKPQEYQGTYWRPGYTCRDLLRYSWQEYRNCRYYYRYYGHYYF